MATTNRTAQWGGIAFMLGSLLFLANKLDEMSRLFFARPMADVISGQDTLLIVIGQVAFIIGFVGVWQLYSERVGRWSKHALRLICSGGIVLALGHVAFMSSLPPFREGLFLLVMAGVFFLIIGLIWFGVLNLRQPVLVQWQWLPLVTGLMGFIGFFLFGGGEITAVFLLFRTLFALGLLGLGLTMTMDKSFQPRIA